MFSFSNVLKYIEELTSVDELEDIIQSAKDQIKSIQIKEENES